MKYIDAEKLKRFEEMLADIIVSSQGLCTYEACKDRAKIEAPVLIASLQQEQPEGNKLPSKRTRVNYAICKLQSFKPLREAIVLDGYVYDEGKCYRENLLNYIHAIPESRITEIRSYLKEKGWWPYDDDVDWGEHGQPEVDLEKVTNYSRINKLPEGFDKEWLKYYHNDNEYNSAKFHHTPTVEREYIIARHFYSLGLNARKEDEQ